MKLKRILSGILAATVAATSLSISLPAIAAEEPTPDVFNFTYYQFPTPSYGLSLKSDYVDIMKAAGTTEIVEPDEYDDGEHGKLPISSSSWNLSSEDSYVTSITYSNKKSVSGSPASGSFNKPKALTKVVFKYSGDDFNIGRSLGSMSVESPIKEIYFYASKVTCNQDAFWGMSEDLKIYVASDDVKLAILNATESSTRYVVKAEQIIVMEDEPEPTPDVFNFTYYQFPTPSYGLSLKSDYVDIMKKAGITEIVEPDEYDDGEHGKLPISSSSWNLSSEDSYVTSITYSNKKSVSGSPASGSFNKPKALTKVVFKYSGDDFNIGRSLGSMSVESPIKEIYFYASKVTCNQDAFWGMSEDLKIYVASDDVKLAILNATESSTRYVVKAEQVIVMNGSGGSSLVTSKLDKTIEAAGKYTEANYTKESFTALTEAIKAGEAAKTKDGATQSDINNAEKAIRDAVTGLVKAGDTSTLKEKIDEAGKLVDALESGFYVYTTPSRDALREAIKTAQGVYDKLTSTTEDLPEEADFLSALDTLTKAMTIDETGEAETGLKKKANGSEWADFGNANNQFPKQNNDSYTEDSWAKYWEVYQKYQEARDKGAGYFTSKQLTDILDAVKAAMNELKVLPPKTEEYKAEKQKALDILNAENSPYTKKSLESVREYVNGAISRIEDENGAIKEGITQHDVDSTTNSIKSYITQLVEKGDVTELKALTEECKPLIESDYTIDTWTALAEKLATAQALVDDPDNAGKAAVEKATEELKAAKEALVIDYGEGEKTPGIVVVKTGGASSVIESGTADESMAGATKVRVTFDCAPNVSFNSYASIEVTALVGEDNNFKKFAGNNNTTGAKGCSVTLDLANAIKAGDSYTISADTYAWENEKDYVYAIMQVEYLDAEGNVLKTFGGTFDTTKLDNYKKAIEDAKALIESGEYTEESVAVLQAAIEAAEAVLKDNDTPLPSEMEAPKAALDKAIEELVEIPKGNDVSGTVTTPGTDAEVTVTVATADGEAVAEVAAANGEYTIPELEDGEYVITFAAEGYVTRSYTATVTNGEIDIEAELHAVGDINGDGNITTVDVGLANAHAKATKTLEGYDFEVAEVSGDDIITTVDVGMINSTAKRV